MPMTLISRQTLTGSAASVTFSSIPQTFQTLKLVCSVRNTDTGGGAIYIQFNTASATYSSRYMFGNGSSATSGTTTTGAQSWMTSNDYTANTFGSTEFVIPNYTGLANKAISADSVSENNATSSYQSMTAGLWSNTSAITSVSVVNPGSFTFVSGCTFSLYGVS